MARADRPILLVEDNPDDEELTLMSLRDAGIKNPIHVARDGVDALAWLEAREPAALPAVVLLDLGLPRLDGFEVLARLRARAETREVAVVVLTSSDVAADIARSYRLGVNSYVRKPVEFGEFAEAVRRLGLYWLVLNEPPQTTEVSHG
ncbi:MAG: response regulator [Myxococcota bacterium]